MPVAGYADLGLIGVLVAAVLYGIIFAVFLRGWKCRSTSARFVTLYYLILVIAGFRLSIEALMQTFYWLMLATWGMHFVSRFTFLQPAKVLNIGTSVLPRAVSSDEMR